MSDPERIEQVQLIHSIVIYIIGPLVACLATVVGFLLKWNLRQQDQLDKSNVAHAKCLEENKVLAARITKVETVVNGGLK